MLHEEDKF